MILHIQRLASGGLLTSGVGVIAQAIPSVPDNFQSWPAISIIGLLALVSMSILAYTIHVTGRCQIETAASLAKMAEQEEERGRRMDELCQKIGDQNTQSAITNERLGEMNANLRRRPNIQEDKC